MHHLVRELWHALHLFRESRGFAATVVAALALGIGANTAVFSLVNAVWLKPLPFPESGRLVRLINTRNRAPADPGASPVEFVYWRAQHHDVLEDIAAFRYVGLNFAGDAEPAQITALQASEGYFRTFRAPIIRGRSFTPDEELPGAAKTAIVSYEFWQHRLGGDPNIVGRVLSFSGESHTVVGVLGAGFDLRSLGRPEVWIPLPLDPATTNRGIDLQVVARLGPGVTMAEAQTRLAAWAAPFRARYPDAMPQGAGFGVQSFRGSLVTAQVRAELWVLLGAVSFVLLIACTNVANLLLLRAASRRREIAIRSALGAGPGRIVLQLLTESTLLSLAGGILGLGAGFAGMRALLGVSTAGLPRLGPAGSFVGLDWRVVGFTLALALATGIVFGLAPALVAARTDLGTTINESGSRAGEGWRRSKVRSALVTVEIALAVVLLIGAALLIRTSAALNAVDPGFDVDHVLTLRTSLSAPRFASSRAVEQTARAGLERVRTLPGVVDAAASCCVPLQASHYAAFSIAGRADNGPSEGAGALVTTTGRYFSTLGVALVRGRAFDDRDAAGGAPVVVINEAMAKRYWPAGADPLRDRLSIDMAAGNPETPARLTNRRIVGVVGDMHAMGLAADPVPTVFVPQAQVPDAFTASNAKTFPLAWIVRTKGDPAALSAAVKSALQQTTGLPATNVRSMERIRSLSLARGHLNMLLMSIFAAVALVLAAIGVYGVLAYAVEQRTKEIGLRMALGAEAGRVERMIMRQGMLCAALGIAAGLVAAFYSARVLAAFLFRVRPHDPAVFVTVPALLAVVALAAAWVPARRASRVDALDALRHE